MSKASAQIGTDSRAASESPRPILLPYQRDWVSDQARFKIGCWSRQTGKSFSTAAEAVADAMTRKTTWVTMSRGERQALEWLAKAREWAQAFEFAISDEVELRSGSEALLREAEIRWPNGSRLIAIPANPDTARGYSANITLDEFAIHDDPDGVWRSVYGSIANPLKEKFKIRVVSTPNGKGNKFFDLWSAGRDWSPQASALKKGEWSRHLIDIHAACARGLPVDIEELRAGMNDAEGWAQEFECQFLDSSAVLLPYDVIAGIENVQASVSIHPEYWMDRSGPSVDLGIDFGRKKNLSVCWAIEETPGGYGLTREVLEMQSMSTPEQLEILSLRIERARRVSFDYTGPGVGLGDFLVQKFGQWDPDRHLYGKVELVTVTNAIKVDVFSKLRMAADSRMIGIPISRVVREDLHSVHRIATPSGNVTYAAPLSGDTKDSHADRCFALALCIRARSQKGGEFAYSPVGRPPRGSRLRGGRRAM